ncbi:hypothetical protein [Microvirga sp. Mcv34]|uniref:hypothetical protein n=1 Tax=Microvirga sp. Mcv34 TaxID=2926016 RepID=UPI0021C87189|nr:hypothetical protein [Microvirga sp. Mcv34]
MNEPDLGSFLAFLAAVIAAALPVIVGIIGLSLLAVVIGVLLCVVAAFVFLKVAPIAGIGIWIVGLIVSIFLVRDSKRRSREEERHRELLRSIEARDKPRP